MSEENKFQKNLLKKKTSDNPENNSNSNSSENYDSDIIVPDQEDIDERFRALDEVTEHFAQEQLLGPNTHQDVLLAAQLAKKGKSKLVSSKNEGRSKVRE